MNTGTSEASHLRLTSATWVDEFEECRSGFRRDANSMALTREEDEEFLNAETAQQAERIDRQKLSVYSTLGSLARS